MTTKLYRRTLATFVAGVALLGIVGPGLSQAAPTPGVTTPVGETNSSDGQARLAAIQKEIAWQLARQPDGRQVAVNKIVWEKQGVELTLPLPGDKSVMANCATRLVCLFGDSDYNNGPDVQPWVLGFYYCDQRDLGDWGKRNQMTSWDNNQTPAGTRAWIFRYRDESRPGDGLIQLHMAPSPHQDPLVYPNDSADVIRPC